jgi:hypothetical protein
MRFRKLGVLLVAILASVGLYSPAHAQVPPGVYVPEAICVVTGSVQLADGGSLPAAESFPLGTEDGAESFTFVGVNIVCAGAVTGVCPVGANGSTEQGFPTSGFTGTFDSAQPGGAPCTTGQTCKGDVGGTGLISWAPGLGGVPMPTTHLPPSDEGFPLDPPWSFTAGNLILAGLDEVNCTAAAPLPGITDGDGLLALAAVPVPVPVSGGCEDADLFPVPAPVVYCSLQLAGVAVLLAETPDGA